MDLISFPFRLAADGHVATVPQDSDASRAELLAVLLLTRIGERPLCPQFGVTDMTGHGLNDSELAAAVATFGPDVDLIDVTIDTVTQDTQKVTVTFQ